MKKRVFAGILWFFAGWYAWNLLASFVGVSDIAGPIVGLAAGLLIAVDPLGHIWSRPHTAQGVETPSVAEPA
jgi:hypothetical protein